jgi:hypothetical protein
VVRRGRIQTSRQVLRRWLATEVIERPARFAVEACTGWRFVIEELAAAEIEAHLATGDGFVDQPPRQVGLGSRGGRPHGCSVIGLIRSAQRASGASTAIPRRLIFDPGECFFDPAGSRTVVGDEVSDPTSAEMQRTCYQSHGRRGHGPQGREIIVDC